MTIKDVKVKISSLKKQLKDTSISDEAKSLLQVELNSLLKVEAKAEKMNTSFNRVLTTK